MKNTLIIFAALAVVFYATRKVTTMVAQKDSENPNVQAFLTLIKKYESRGGDYAIIYGGGHFTSFDSHPNIRVPFIDPRTGKQNYSTAAGAYQITRPTWLLINAGVSLPDFSPQSQDLAAIWLLKYCGAMPFILAGDFTNALKKASTQWASLPYTASMQNHVSVDTATKTYLAAGGTISGMTA